MNDAKEKINIHNLYLLDTICLITYVNVLNVFTACCKIKIYKKNNINRVDDSRNEQSVERSKESKDVR